MTLSDKPSWQRGLCRECGAGCRHPNGRCLSCREAYEASLRVTCDDCGVVFSNPGGFALHEKSHGQEEARFWAKVDMSGECWLWTGYLRRDGYGTFQIAGVARQVHRVAFEFVNGPVPDGYQVDHLCRVRACVNPTHLEAVTQQENIARAAVVRYPQQAVAL